MPFVLILRMKIVKWEVAFKSHFPLDRFSVRAEGNYPTYCLSQFQLGTTPGQPPGKLFSASESRPSFFVLFPAPGQKMMVEFLGVGQNFPKLEDTAL